MTYSMAFTQAILIMIFVGDKVQQGFYELVPTKEISESLNIPRPSAAKILGNLSAAGLIETREGANGGVRLGVDPKVVTLLSVFQAIELGRPLFKSDFSLAVTGKKPDRVKEVMLDIFTNTQQAMEQQLAAVSIAALIERLNE
jgi:Rrf2 family protein